MSHFVSVQLKFWVETAYLVTSVHFCADACVHFHSSFALEDIFP